MNILLLTQIYPEPDDKDGYKPTRTVEYFAKEWTKAGHKVLVIHCQTKFPLLYYLVPNKVVNFILKNSYAIIPSLSSRKEMYREENDVRIIRLPMRKLFPSTAFSKFSMNRQVKKILRICNQNGYKPNIVMGHFANPCFELTARIGSELNVRSSFVFHNDCSIRNINRYNLRNYIDSIDIIGGRSVIETASIKNNLCLSYDPFVCYSGVPNETVENVNYSCTKHNNALHRIQFLFVGGLVTKKHVDTVIDAFSLIYQDGYNLTIVGGGPEENHLQELVKRRGIDKAVTFTGRMDRNQVEKKMKQANIFVMVSEGETFGMVYLEAMLQGCLVIASSGGGFDGIIKDGENGFLSNPGDIKQLTQKFKTIIEAPRSQWNQIGQAAIETAALYSEKSVAEMYLKTVTENLTNGKGDN